MWNLWIKYIAIMAFIVVDGLKMKPARIPVIPGRPFVVLWNSPTELCERRYKIDLDLEVFNIAANANESFIGSLLTLFYYNRLGYYPYIDTRQNLVYGGIPQKQDLVNHLIKSKYDIEKTIPKKMFSGLGIINWEHWRPLWVRNWGDKTIYKNISIDHVQAQHPTWEPWRIKATATEEFEIAGRTLMNRTLSLAKTLRPNGLWGYYLFPDCYNHDYVQNPNNYTGKCPSIELTRNDLLHWLWKQSTAIFPSIYLQKELKSSQNAVKFVRYRVKEAMRVAKISSEPHDLPVFVYSMPVYSSTTDVLTEEDLVSTIGESASLGAAGVVLWGQSKFGISKDICLLQKNYITGPLGHYVINVTSAAKICSETICSNNGKCLRKTSNSTAYLHLPSPSFKIHVTSSQFGRRSHLKGSLRDQELAQWKIHFKCQCFPGWAGFSCEFPCSNKRS